MDRITHAISIGGALLISALMYAYMMFLRVPSVMEVRPELADVGFITGIFSGRGGAYLWYHYEWGMLVLVFLVVLVAGEITLSDP